MDNELDFGYAFEPPCPPEHPCHRRLTVVLRAAPTGRHYDPEKAQWPVVTRHGDLDRLVVYHPWPAGEATRRAACGRVILTDRVGKVAEAFTFGGALSVRADEARVVVVLESPAPILPLMPPQGLAEALADEAETLLARRRAHWDMQGRPQRFEERLARAEPLALYRAVLLAVQQQTAGTHDAIIDPQHRLERFAREAVRALQERGEWPGRVEGMEAVV
jgi:hypothetical protein